MAKPNPKRTAPTPPSEQPHLQAPAERLAELVRTKRTIPYHENIPDKEFSFITCSIYGAPETNELFVKLTNGTVSFVEVAKSGLYCPVMADRIFGMDVADHQTAFELAERMWETHKEALISRSPTQKRPP